FMSSLLELLSGIFVFVNSSQDCNYFLLCRKRYRSAHLCSIFLYSFDNFLGRCINQLMIICLQCVSHYLTCHKKRRLLFVLSNSVRQAVTVHSPVRVHIDSHVVTMFQWMLLIRTVTCRQFPNLTFAPRKNLPFPGSNLTFHRYHVTAFSVYMKQYKFASTFYIFLYFF